MTVPFHEYETLASEATALSAFNGVNLNGVREGVSQLLSTIGKDGFFREYSDHSFSHVSSMLSMLEWLLVEETQRALTPGDWLTLVLSIYFHDLGMVTTQDEFDARDRSSFDAFCTQHLFAGEDGVDYREKVIAYSGDNADKVFYQEFVRAYHAERIKRWINGDTSPEYGVSNTLINEVQGLIGSFDTLYREDLAQLCASHHSDDISDLSISKPYGDSEDETVNLHFLAVVLRVVDLLQVTSARTPAILFRTINPRDPISQIEWKKQEAVRRVRPSPLLSSTDDDGVHDTIEVHATFDAPAGYFGLTSYVEYARRELAHCHEWIEAKQSQYPRRVLFPWKRLDDSHIDARGFLKDAFKFELDNAKILDLLTGHTLYNDSSVVVRELAQNAIDAVRLEHGTMAAASGKVDLNWNSATRTLTVTDNGTGMTQDEIVNNLLRVGASRYQEPEFKNQHPSFNSISRFGIGILSAFMVADEVRITTVSKDEEQARKLTLKSVHGNYLIELLDKSGPSVDDAIRDHGTRIDLRLRASAKIEPLDDVARRFIYFPQCRVTCTIDDGSPINIGAISTEASLAPTMEALESRYAASFFGGKTDIKVVSFTENGFDVSFLVQKWPWSDTWTIVFDRDSGLKEPLRRSLATGICIEGIFVKSGIPGFIADVPICNVNATGVSAPFANVARNDFEYGERYLTLLNAIYGAFAQHINDEFRKLCDERSRSLTHASNEATHMISRVLQLNFKTEQEKEEATRRLLELQVLAVESHGERKTISFEEARRLPEIRLVECPFFSAAEAAIAELASDASISDVVQSLGADDMRLDGDSTYIIGGLRDSAQKLALEGWQITRLIFDSAKRRVDAVWTASSDPFWYTIESTDYDFYGREFRRMGTHLRQHASRLSSTVACAVATTELRIESVSDESFGMAIVGEDTLVLPPSQLNEPLIAMFNAIRSDNQPTLARYLFGLLVLLNMLARLRLLPDEEIGGRRGSLPGQIISGDMGERRKVLRFLLDLEQEDIPKSGIPVDEFLRCVDINQLEVFSAFRKPTPSF